MRINLLNDLVKKLIIFFICLASSITVSAQINTDRVILIGRNALYFEDYLLSIQYFNQAIKAKPYLSEPYYYRAIAKYYLDDFKGAEEDCSRSIEINPFYYKAYQLRADARQNLKEYDGALNDYVISLKNNPEDKFLLINLGIVNIEKKDFLSAEKYLNQLISANPNYIQGILTRGNLYLEKGDTINALKDYNSAIEKDKYFAPSFSMRASVYLAQKKYDKALADYNEAIQIDPLLSANYINRGLTKYYMNDLRGSMSDYDYVIKIDPSNLMAHFNRALLRSQVGDDNNAIKDFNFVLQYEPGNYIAYMNRGLLKNNTGDIKGALIDINKVLNKYPDFYEGFYLRSDIKKRQNDMKGAEQDYLYAQKIENRIRQEVMSGKYDNKKEKTRESSDKSIDKFNLLVVADKEEEQKSKYNNETRGKVQNKQANTSLEPMFVITYYEKETELKKFTHYNVEIDKFNNLNILSRKLIITNQEVPLDSTQVAIHFESINEYSQLINEQPDNDIYYFARGLDYMLVQDFLSAIEDFTKAISINPNFTLAYFNLAVSYTKQLQSQQMLPDLYKQQQDYSSEYNINMQLGNDKKVKTNMQSETGLNIRAMKSLVEYESILKNYTKVIELSSNFEYAYYNRAEIKSDQNDYRASILDYNEAIKIDPDFAEALYNRGINRLKVKDNERGLKDLRKAGELGVTSAYSIIKRMTE